jgi:hypothetical protein
MPAHDASHNVRLLRFNQQVLEQALAVVAAHCAVGAPSYADPVGAHLRHLVEHHEALINALDSGVVDYDSRPRDRALESTASIARQRLLALCQWLGQCTAEVLDLPVQVLGQGGIAGEFTFCVASSFGRELAFVASHAVHHFALLAAHCQQQGIATPAHFGKAPSTVAHDIAVSQASTSASINEVRSSALPVSA